MELESYVINTVLKDLIQEDKEGNKYIRRKILGHCN